MKNNKISAQLYSSLPVLSEHKVWAEIDVRALLHNYLTVSEHIGEGVRKICVVKADAYGHGAGECVRMLLRAGCDFFAVSSIDEAIAVRRAAESIGAFCDILILGYTLPSQAELLAKEEITQAILSPEYARALSGAAADAGVVVKCHIAVDSGMNRIGICARTPSEVDIAAEGILEIAALRGLSITGMFSHFASADRDSVAGRQYELFRALTERLEGRMDPIFCHICNSVATVRRQEYHLDGVRIGILLYGVPEAKEYTGRLLPVMKLKTIISHLHTLPAGEHVGYDGEYVAEDERVVATLPIGYADGYMRGYKGASVRVYTETGEVECPVLGRICMDQCMIDVTGTDARIGDEVLMFGDREGRMLSSLASLAKTNEYECLCLVSSRVPRIYTGD